MTRLFPRIISPSRIFFIVNNVAVQLEQGRLIYMATNVTIGHEIDCAISYLDAIGNPMVTAPTPDAPPAWSDTTPGVLTLTAAPDGSTCVAKAVAAGSDTINLSVTVGGKPFTASLAVAVSAAPQVLTSVAIVPTVN